MCVMKGRLDFGNGSENYMPCLYFIRLVGLLAGQVSQAGTITWLAVAMVTLSKRTHAC